MLIWTVIGQFGQGQTSENWPDLNFPPKTVQIGLFQLNLWYPFSFTFFQHGDMVNFAKFCDHNCGNPYLMHGLGDLFLQPLLLPDHIQHSLLPGVLQLTHADLKIVDLL